MVVLGLSVPVMMVMAVFHVPPPAFVKYLAFGPVAVLLRAPLLSIALAAPLFGLWLLLVWMERYAFFAGVVIFILSRGIALAIAIHELPIEKAIASPSS
jgi:hypothetical protein